MWDTLLWEIVCYTMYRSVCCQLTFIQPSRHALPTRIPLTYARSSTIRPLSPVDYRPDKTCRSASYSEYWHRWAILYGFILGIPQCSRHGSVVHGRVRHPPDGQHSTSNTATVIVPTPSLTFAYFQQN